MEKMNNKIELLSVVALMKNIPDKKLQKGQLGAVVEVLAPDVFLVEFCDYKGRTISMEALKTDVLLLLHQEPFESAIAA